MSARLMQGNEAVAEGALKAGVRFFGGYPITPSTEIAEGMAKMLPQVGGTFIQCKHGRNFGRVIGWQKSFNRVFRSRYQLETRINRLRGGG